MVKIIIDRSPIAKWRPGLMVNYNIKEDDLIPAEGKIELKVQVVLGNGQYRNGKRLTLFLDPALPA